jgi:hypothetical protein
MTPGKLNQAVTSLKKVYLSCQVRKNSCIDPDIISNLVPDPGTYLNPRPTRKDGGCVAATDKGTYDTCTLGCVCCYATNSGSVTIYR